MRRDHNKSALIFVAIVIVVSAMLLITQLDIKVTSLMVSMLCLGYVAAGVAVASWHKSLNAAKILELGLAAALVQIVALSLI